MIDNEIWKLLLVEDDEDDYFIVYKMMSDSRPGRFILDWAPSYREGIQALQNANYDAVLVDYDLGGETGDQLIRDAIAAGCHSPILILTGRGSYDIDVKTMHAGAYDYLNKGELNALFLERSIRYAVERKRAENSLARVNAALHAAERRVRDILSGITDCYFLVDKNWHLIDINVNALDFLKRTDEEMLGKTIWETNPFVEDPITGEELRKALATGQPAHFEMHLKAVLRWADVHAYPVEEGIAVYFADITKRKRGEQNTQFLATLGEKLIAQNDPDIMMQSSLEAIATYLHVDHCLLEAVLPDQAAIQIVAEYHTQPPPEGEQEFRPLAIGAYMGIPRLIDGQWVNTLTVATSTPRQWQEDEVAVLRQASDLIWLSVENARLLQNLKLSQTRFDIALKNSDITVYTTDRDLRYTWLYRPMPPYLTEQVIGLRDDQLQQAPHLVELLQLKRQVLEHGIGQHQEVQLCLGGEPTYLDLTVEPYEGPNGEVDGTIVSCINTTRFHQMEEQIQTTIAQVATQRRIMESRENERKEISRDLHDGPIQNTIGLIFSIEEALTITQESKLHDLLKGVQKDAQKLVSELRGVCNQLRPPVLAEFGLAKAIRSYITGFQEKFPHISLQLDLCDDGQLLPEATRLALYRIMQEGLSNVARHSQATQIRIAYQLEDQNAILVIQDNGKGFQTGIDWGELVVQGHLGLVGMKERMEALNGRLEIQSNASIGTQLRAVVPFQT